MKRRSSPLYGPYGSGRTLYFYVATNLGVWEDRRFSTATSFGCKLLNCVLWIFFAFWLVMSCSVCSGGRSVECMKEDWLVLGSVTVRTLDL